MATETNLEKYYARRASEYESIYSRPERQDNLQELKKILTARFSGEQVLELACGTGCWTEVVSHTASSILAMDINDEVLHIARSKKYGSPVSFVIADVYNLSTLQQEYSAGLCVFWWSHIPKARLHSFLTGFHRVLKKGGKVCFIDNRYVEGNSTPISKRDEFGDTFQIRTLKDGSTHEVLKNYPTTEELIEAVSIYGHKVEVKLLDYFWILEYSVT